MMENRILCIEDGSAQAGFRCWVILLVCSSHFLHGILVKHILVARFRSKSRIPCAPFSCCSASRSGLSQRFQKSVKLRCNASCIQELIKPCRQGRIWPIGKGCVLVSEPFASTASPEAQKPQQDVVSSNNSTQGPTRYKYHVRTTQPQPAPTPRPKQQRCSSS